MGLQFRVKVEFANHFGDARNHTTGEVGGESRVDSGEFTIGPARFNLVRILHHARVGRHIREVNERQASLEETGAAAELDGVVTLHIIHETYAGRYLNPVVRPLAGINLHVITEVVCEDGCVGSDIAIIKNEIVETHAIGELELVVHVPLVLQIEADLVEGDLCVRIEFSVPAVSDGEGFGRAVEDIDDGGLVGPGITVVAGAVTHVSVIGELVLIVESSDELVISHEVGHVILDGPDLVVDTVVPGEQLITEGHVRLPYTLVVLLDDVDVRERGGIGTADVLDVGVGDKQLVGDPVIYLRVVVEGNGRHLVVLGIHIVCKSHGFVTYAECLVKTISSIGGIAVRGVPCSILGIVVAQ